MGCSCVCFFTNPPPCVALLPIPLLIFSCNYWGFGFFSTFLTSSALVLSTLLISSSKSKEQEAPIASKECFLSSEVTTQNREAQESSDQLPVLDFDHSSSSEDSEVDHSPDWSDGYISDEESLFEIALPSGHCVGEESKLMNRNFPDLLQLEQTLKELLAEINEEDNMIEIDISMGSIKCSRFEIEA